MCIGSVFKLAKAIVGRHAAVGVLAATYRSASFHARHPSVVDDRILYIAFNTNKNKNPVWAGTLQFVYLRLPTAWFLSICGQ